MKKITLLIVVIVILAATGVYRLRPINAQKLDSSDSGSKSAQKLPPNAVIGSTAERKAAWDKLSEDQKAKSSENLKGIIENARAQSRPAGQRTNTVLSFSSDSGKRRDVNASINSDDKLRSGGSGAPTLRPIDPCVDCDPPDPTPTPTPNPTPTVTPTATPTPSPTPTVTPTPTPTPGGDADIDGLDDTFENSLADGFTPYYHVSGSENSGTGFATFNNSVPQTVNQSFGPVPPISHYRVTPLGYGSINGVQYGFIQIDYLTLWNRDDGLVCSSICYFLAPDLGISLDELTSHNLDNERAAALVAAPVVNGTYDLNQSSYKA